MDSGSNRNDDNSPTHHNDSYGILIGIKALPRRHTEAGVVVQVAGVVGVFAAEDAVAADLAHGMGGREFGMLNGA